MIITKASLKARELLEAINYLTKELSIKPTTSIDFHDWLFIAGKVRNSYNGRVAVNYHIVARNKVTFKCVEKLAKTYKEIQEFLIAIIAEAEEGR